MSNERVNAFMLKVKELAEGYPDLNVLVTAIGGPEEIAGMMMLSQERGLTFEDAMMTIQTALGTMAVVMEECGGQRVAGDLRGFAGVIKDNSGIGVEKLYQTRQIPN